MLAQKILCICRLLKEFGISQAALSSLETEEEKQHYIVTMMKKKLDEDYEKWKKEVEKTEKDIQKHEHINELKKMKFEKERADVYKWLRLKTKYDLMHYSLLNFLICQIPFFKEKAEARANGGVEPCNLLFLV